MPPHGNKSLEIVLVFIFLSVGIGLIAMRTQLLPLVGAVAYGFAHAGSAAGADHGNASQLRMNQFQVVGTHNSYHREISRAERDIFEKFVPGPLNYYYSHSNWSSQFNYQSVRSGEIDLHSDTVGGLYADPLIWKLSNLTNDTVPYHDDNMLKPGLKVFHVTDVDTNAICHTFVECLQQLKEWSDANPQHLPLTFDLELKTDALACALGGVCAEEATTWTLDRILNVDKEIRSVLPAEKLIVPDNVRQANMTLEESILTHGWPTLAESRGKFMFYFDNEVNATDNIRALYTANGHESLQNRTVWTNSDEGLPDCAMIKFNTPNVTEIQRLVQKGYFVRTRADDPITTVLSHDLTRRDQAFNSSAQIVSTDFPVYGMSARWDWDYAVQLGSGKVARCNPISAPAWCRDEMLQDTFVSGFGFHHSPGAPFTSITPCT